MRNEFLNKLKKERTSYKDMIDFCCDSMILNNDIMHNLSAKGFYFELVSGEDYDEENDYYYDVYQLYIIGDEDARRLTEYTNELVYYCYDLDLYLLGVCHWGTHWSGVASNWVDELN